jgi:hypothetical protein
MRTEGGEQSSDARQEKARFLHTINPGKNCEMINTTPNIVPLLECSLRLVRYEIDSGDIHEQNQTTSKKIDKHLLMCLLFYILIKKDEVCYAMCAIRDRLRYIKDLHVPSSSPLQFPLLSI